MGSAPWRVRLAASGLVALVATGAVACTSTHSTTTTTTASPGSAGGGGGAGDSTISPSAFSDHTGITPSSVHVGNVSTLAVGGLFKGALVGTEAYADYVDSTGGVNGRMLVVDGADDGFTGAGNEQATRNAIDNDFALVGGFSLEDSYGGTLLGADRGVPDVSVVLDPATGALPNVFSAVPLLGGWEEGPLQYFKQKYPEDIAAVGTITSSQPSALRDWAGEKYVMEKIGYKVVYEPSIPATQTDFTADVIAMRNAGVKILFIDQLPERYASSLPRDLVQQNFHPQVVLGAAGYSSSLVAAAGGPAAVDGAQVEQNTSFYLGGDASAVPAVALFDHWVRVASPGFEADLSTLYGWLSAELFCDALHKAGSDPSRGSLLQALSTITSFTGDDLVAPADPAAKTVGNCYVLGQVVGGRYERLDDPPVSGSTHGYRCDYRYVLPPGH